MIIYKMNKNIDISIIITTYNYSNYIAECIDSCLSQLDTKLNYEVIVIDDGSTDDTQKVLQKINDAKLKKYLIKNSGIEGACNFAFGLAHGDYVVRVDADDKLNTEYLSEMESFIGNEFGFYYPDYFVINQHGALVKEVSLPAFEPEEIMSRGDFLATGTVYSKKILGSLMYSTEIKNSGLENYELILRLVTSSVNGRHIPKKLFSYRRHTDNISIKKYTEIQKNGQAIFNKMNLGLYQSNKNHPYLCN